MLGYTPSGDGMAHTTRWRSDAWIYTTRWRHGAHHQVPSCLVLGYTPRDVCWCGYTCHQVASCRGDAYNQDESYCLDAYRQMAL